MELILSLVNEFYYIPVSTSHTSIHYDPNEIGYSFDHVFHLLVPLHPNILHKAFGSIALKGRVIEASLG